MSESSSTPAATMPKVKLASKEGKEFTVDENIAKMSTVVTRLLEDLKGFRDSPEDDDEPIPLLAVTSEQLEIVLQWCTYHKDDPPPQEVEDDEELETNVYKLCSWDQAFFSRMEQALFIGTINAACYMEIPLLTSAALNRQANIIRGKTTEEMREILGIQNDLSPEEETELHVKFGWCRQ